MLIYLPGMDAVDLVSAPLALVRAALTADPVIVIAPDAVTKAAARLRAIARSMAPILARQREGYADHEERLRDRDENRLDDLEERAGEIASGYGLRIVNAGVLDGFYLRGGEEEMTPTKARAELKSVADALDVADDDSPPRNEQLRELAERLRDASEALAA